MFLLWVYCHVYFAQTRPGTLQYVNKYSGTCSKYIIQRWLWPWGCGLSRHISNMNRRWNVFSVGLWLECEQATLQCLPLPLCTRWRGPTSAGRWWNMSDCRSKLCHNQKKKNWHENNKGRALQSTLLATPCPYYLHANSSCFVSILSSGGCNLLHCCTGQRHSAQGSNSITKLNFPYKLYCLRW